LCSSFLTQQWPDRYYGREGSRGSELAKARLSERQDEYYVPGRVDVLAELNIAMCQQEETAPEDLYNRLENQ
jgi:hypothetical protein